MQPTQSAVVAFWPPPRSALVACAHVKRMYKRVYAIGTFNGILPLILSPPKLHRMDSMGYKVFLVEDEIVTREGIRDSVAWDTAGYQFCGEAPDGELALPLIREHEPDVVITDIRMPFMDGLQLSRQLREILPNTKIIILSGHDEFKYAQEAIQIGVTEYLLKPLSAQHLLEVLQKVANQIDQERAASAQIALLRTGSTRQVAGPTHLQPTLIKPATRAIEQLLRSGVRADIPQSIRAYLQPLEGGGAHGRMQIEYVLTDAMLTVAHVLRDLGVDPDTAVPELQALAPLLSQVHTLAQAAAAIASTLERAMDHRDLHAHHQNNLAERARAYILAHSSDPDLSLSEVATHVMLSPSYLSALFSSAVGQTFIEFLTGVRVRHAIELLRTTSLTSSEIANRVGYQNPRYFFSVFRKVTGQSPTTFRRAR
ncbi:response regulator [Chloroflexia bacterium SDU3-3]|nr:response regulator [Chloroflexia bacterium SDU3-3]